MGEQQADPVGPAQIQILADDGFEEVAALHGTGKDLREADLHLLQREPMGVAGGAIDRGQRRRQARRPAIEEPLHVGRPELIADRLQVRGIGTGEEAVVETVKRDVRAPQLLLHPLVAVETELDRDTADTSRISGTPAPSPGRARRSSSD